MTAMQNCEVMFETLTYNDTILKLRTCFINSVANLKK